MKQRKKQSLKVNVKNIAFLLVPDILNRNSIIFSNLKLFSKKDEVMWLNFFKQREQQERDGRMTIVFLLLFVLFSHQQITRINTLMPKSKYLSYTHDKLLYLTDEEKSACHPEPPPLCYYPFFFLPPPINTSDKELLMTMKGIGPALAENIIQYRQKADVLSNIDDLRKIPGISGKRAAALANEVTFDTAE